MNRRSLVVLLLLLIAAPARASLPTLEAMVNTLADESMRGRGAGSDELVMARNFVRDWFEEAGLMPGMPGGAWYQPFEGAKGEKLDNVVGRIGGTGDEWIVVGAHYDGLGVGEKGSEHPGEIHPGADDNASGVAALVTLAASLAEDGDFERSIYVVAFGGEETGRLGSEHFAAHPPRDIARLAAMLNLDTVGRVEDNRLIVFGSGTAEEFPSLLNGVNNVFRFDLALNEEGAGASDHASFFAKGVPVLHFFTGAKKEYHRPGDVASLVDADETARVAGFAGEVAAYLASGSEPLTFRPKGADRLAEPEKPVERRRVSFGSIPDFSRESGGILLSGVMPGGGAEKAGLLKGDVIVKIGDSAIDNIYDFQGVLSGHTPGDTLHVHYVREGAAGETDVVLGERK